MKKKNSKSCNNNESCFPQMEKRYRLMDLFSEMAKKEANNERLHDWSDILKQIYTKDFRHYYSDFLHQLDIISKTQNAGAIDILSENAFRLQRYVHCDESVNNTV